MIKRLYALERKKARTPQDATAQLMNQYNQQRDPDLKTTLNGINRKTADIGGVRLSDIRRISGRVDGENGPDEGAAQITAPWLQSEAARQAVEIRRPMLRRMLLEQLVVPSPSG